MNGMHILGRRAWFAGLAQFLMLVAFSPPALAHDFTITATSVRILSNRTYQIDMTCDLDALALGAANNADSAKLAETLRAMSREELEAALQRLRELFQKRVRIRFDGTATTPSVDFPEYGATPSEHSEFPSVLGVTARLAGPIPDGALELTFWASRAFQAVHLTVVYDDDPDPQPLRHILGVAEESPPIPLAASRVAEHAAAGSVLEYFRLGFEHIVPKGVDHILFVLGLFFLSTKWKPLLAQVTAFTLAHSLTLGLSLYGVFSLPPRFVEPLIALSIAVVAIENMATSKLHAWRTLVVFGFGLLHGLGFAGILSELGLPRGEYLPALISFNCGVEAGQLAVLAGAFLIVGWWRSKIWYRAWITIPISGVIAALGLYAAVQRAFLPDLPTLL